MVDSTPNPLLGRDLAELLAFAEELQEPSYRAQQLFESIYRQRVSSVQHISTLPARLRQDLAVRGISIGWPTIDSKFQSADGSEAGDETAPPRTWDRATICVSSQVGCAVDCRFCLTALLGVKRNLTAGEIVGQVCSILRDQEVSPPQDRVNLVFMGMGEPFLNYENFIKAVRLLVEGVGIAESRMTVSTAGIVPRIHDLGAEPVRPKLAISLTAANDELRSRLMPINRKWNLEKLMSAAREFPLRSREKLTFEYVLLKGVNDSAAHARELVEVLRGVTSKVNLIALNPGPGIHFETPEQKAALEFQKILGTAGIPAFIRRPRGRDIYAACGQLKRT